MYKFDSKNHIHTLDGKPLMGTSTVVSVLAKPLTWWASGLAVEKFGWLNPKKNSPEAVAKALADGWDRVKRLNLAQYEQLLAEAYKAHSVKLKDTAEAGTDLHAELEKYVKWKMSENKVATRFDTQIIPFIQWADENVKKFLWSEAHCYDAETFTGGITDAGAELNNGQIAVIDFKSSSAAYDSHFIQVAGYCIQIEKNGVWSSNGKHSKKLEKPISQIIIIPFGMTNMKPQIKYDIETWENGFKHCVALYKLLNFQV